jgi:methyl-accepting chemotaxis protein-1 (serine sensor receptor)
MISIGSSALRNLSIKARLVGVIVFLSLQLIAGGIIGIGSLRQADAEMQSMYENELVNLGQLDQIIRLMSSNEMAIGKSVSASQELIPKIIFDVKQRSAQADKIWSEYMTTRLAPDERKLAEEFAARRAKYEGQGIKVALDAMEMLDTQSVVAALNGPMAALFEPMRDSMDALIKLQRNLAHDSYTRSQNTYHLVRNSCVAALLLGITLAAAVGWWLIRSISAPLDEAVRFASSVAEGDLTQAVHAHANDEVGRLMRALNQMHEGLLRIVSQVRMGTETIAAGAKQIAAGNQDLSSRTEQQASSLEETASSLEELTATVKQNANNALQANQLAGSASAVADKGGEVVARVIDTMGSINESSKKIGDIISVIDGIAFQTNILALNAAVEAARAGEQGKGFAVVATEVRSLAQRSANAAKEIKTLVGASLENASSGSKLVDEAGATMQEIVQSIKRVTDLMAEIAAASQEQSAGIEQINKAISQMEQVTQQNASLVEEAAAASESMHDQAHALTQAVSVFKMNATDSAGTPLPPTKLLTALT